MAGGPAIPLVDLKAQYRTLEPAIGAKLREVLESAAFIQGPFVAEFEKAFLASHGAAFGAGCSSGTSALFLALAALGVGPGDEVITTANTFIATAEAICHTGATPIFADVDPETWALSPVSVQAALTARTRAIVPVHIYGNVCDMEAIGAIAREHRLLVVEDCAQSHLATWRGRFAGTLGDAAAFSFYPGKNLGAYGDAGFVFTRTREAETTVRKLLDHGRLTKYEHDQVGYNHRMDGLQGAVLSVKLPHLVAWTAARRAHAARYDRLLEGTGLQRMRPTPGSEPVYHLYPVQVANRAEVMKRLQARGIATGIHYPVPLHLQPAFAGRAPPRGALPVAEALASRVLSLPLYPELTSEQLERVAGELRQVARA